jgi:hypothetical protein
LLDEILQAEIRVSEAEANMIKQLLRQVDNDLQSNQPKGRRL